MAALAATGPRRVTVSSRQHLLAPVASARATRSTAFTVAKKATPRLGVLSMASKSARAVVAAEASGAAPAAAAQRPPQQPPVPLFAPAQHSSSSSGPRSSSDEEGHEGADFETAQDVGNVVLLEHVNLEVLDLEVARLFYGEGLGLCADPSTTAQQRGGLHVMWYNIGRQQLHIVRGPSVQRLPLGGAIGIVLPDLPRVAERLEHVKQLLGDVSISYVNHDTLEVRDPSGVTFLVHASGSLPGFPAERGIAYLQLPCFRGTAGAIANFYATHMGARCVVSGGPSAPAAAGAHPHGVFHPGRAEVCMGPGQKLVFVEQKSLGEPNNEAVSRLDEGWHACMYVAEFSRAYRLMEHRGLISNDHPYRDKCGSLQDALRNHQFRFRDIPLAAQDAGQGHGAAGGVALAYRLNHEVRSMHHPLFARALFNRDAGTLL